MQEDQHPQQPFAPETVAPKVKESKIRVDEDAPNRLGETKDDKDSGLPSGVNSFEGTLTFSPELMGSPVSKKMLGVEDEKEHKNRPPSSEPVKPTSVSTPLTTEPTLDVKDSKSRPLVTGSAHPGGRPRWCRQDHVQPICCLPMDAARPVCWPV